MDAGAADLAVRRRRPAAASGELGSALDEGSVIEAFAFRGATHFLAVEDAGSYLALKAAGRQWELRSWREFYGLEPEDWPAFRAAVREALGDGPLTLSELGQALTAAAAYRHLRPVFDEGAGTLIKPLCWQGDVCLGRRDGALTLRRLDRNPRWSGPWDLDDAGRHAVTSFVGGYGPTTSEQVHRWLGDGLGAGRARLRRWLADLDDRIAEVDVDGAPRLILAEDRDALLSTAPEPDVVHLLPGHDQWVMGPGSQDEQVVPPPCRQAVTRKADLVLVDGVVRGTWRRRGDQVAITWLEASSRVPDSVVADEVRRLGDLLGRSLSLAAG